jgi:hypothetical protein
MLKPIFVLFWAAWWFIAFFTDVAGGLSHLQLLHVSWSNDANYLFLVQSLQLFQVPTWIPVVCFIGIIAWSGLSCALFAWASFGFMCNNSHWMRRVDLAFIVSLTFWLAFFIMDQLILNFDLEQNHMVQGGFELLTYLAIKLLPEQRKN